MVVRRAGRNLNFKWPKEDKLTAPMKQHSRSKLVHFASTAWFMLCMGYILVFVLRRAGFRWWVIFSLSGHSVLFILLLISLYLFAIFRGVDRSQKIEIEHPLTSDKYYTVFYDISPFWGGIAGFLGTIGVNRVSELLLGIALGTLMTTFLVWVVVDAVMGFIERLLPASRRHRLERLAGIRALRQKHQEEQQRLLAEIEAQEELNRHRWQQALQPYARELAGLLSESGYEIDDKRAETEAVKIGATVWQMGGLDCMRQLYFMTMSLCKKNENIRGVDYLSVWWDGIGSWRTPCFS
jgi:hypothetical protein